MMAKIDTFIDSNKTWVYDSMVVAFLSVTVWLLGTIGEVNKTLSLINAKLEYITDQTNSRAVYIDSRITDHESRIRALEQSSP